MRLCENCSTENADDAVYCKKCGQLMDGSTDDAAPQEKKGSSNRWITILIAALVVVCLAGVGAAALLIGKVGPLIAAYQVQPTRTSTPLPSTDTPLPTNTLTPTVVLATDTPVVVPTLLDQQSWRLPQFHGATFVADDAYTRSDIAAWVADIAHNNAVKEPYYWDLYLLPNDTRFADVENYFIPLETGKGMIKGEDEQGVTVAGNDTFLLSFFSSYDKDASVIYMEFWPHVTSYNAQLLIFYVNP